MTDSPTASRDRAYRFEVMNKVLTLARLRKASVASAGKHAGIKATGTVISEQSESQNGVLLITKSCPPGRENRKYILTHAILAQNTNDFFAS